MPVTVNLRHLEAHNVTLNGELPVEELDLDLRDELVRPSKPLKYDIEIQKLEGGLLLQGELSLPLECHCVRCLKQFAHELRIRPWTRHLPLEGEEKAVIVSDCVDLTPYVREDILLEFPQHPLCGENCRGLPKTTVGEAEKPSDSDQIERKSTPWAELDKLKF